MKDTITWPDFEKLDIRVGTILTAKELEKAKKPAYVLSIDFGEQGIKTSSAQITYHYSITDIIGKQIIAIINFPPKRIAGIKSECLVLGIYDENKNVVLLKTDKKVSNGFKIE